MTTATSARRFSRPVFFQIVLDRLKLGREYEELIGQVAECLVFFFASIRHASDQVGEARERFGREVDQVFDTIYRINRVGSLLFPFHRSDSLTRLT
jgi:hypothetical protein